MFNLWNMALDQDGQPTPNSPGRRGVVTVPSDASGDIVRNPEYYVLGQLSKALRPLAIRVFSTSRGRPYIPGGDDPALTQMPGDVVTTAFLNRDGSIVLYCYNGAPSRQRFNISCAALQATLPVEMEPGELSTFEFSLA
jgi:glucosylceramidase